MVNNESSNRLRVSAPRSSAGPSAAHAHLAPVTRQAVPSPAWPAAHRDFVCRRPFHKGASLLQHCPLRPALLGRLATSFPVRLFSAGKSAFSSALPAARYPVVAARRRHPVGPSVSQVAGPRLQELSASPSPSLDACLSRIVGISLSHVGSSLSPFRPPLPLFCK